jgi:hypothetical protein
MPVYNCILTLLFHGIRSESSIKTRWYSVLKPRSDKILESLQPHDFDFLNQAPPSQRWKKVSCMFWGYTTACVVIIHMYLEVRFGDVACCNHIHFWAKYASGARAVSVIHLICFTNKKDAPNFALHSILVQFHTHGGCRTQVVKQAMCAACACCLDFCVNHRSVHTHAETLSAQDARPYKRARPGAGMMGGQQMQQMQMQQMQMQHMQMPQMQQMQMQHMQMPQMQQMQHMPQAQIVHASAVPANMGMHGVVLGISVNPQ